MSGSTAPEESVMRELIAAFGEERARQIMGDTTPPKRHRPVPTRVGVVAKPLPALRRKPTGEPGLRELQELDRITGRRDRVLRAQIRRCGHPVTCHRCHESIPAGDEVVRLFRAVMTRDYCGACAAEESHGG